MSTIFSLNEQFRFKFGKFTARNNKQMYLTPDRDLDQMSFRNHRHWPQ